MQEQIRQNRTDNPALKSSCRSRCDATVPHLDWSIQPALDVKKHPGTIRMFADGLEQQLPIDAVEGSGDTLPISTIIRIL